MSKALRKQGAEVLSEKKYPLSVNGHVRPRVHRIFIFTCNPPNRKRLQGAADARRRVCRLLPVLQVPDLAAGSQATKQMRCPPVNAHLFAKAEMAEDVVQHFISDAVPRDFSQGIHCLS